MARERLAFSGNTWLILEIEKVLYPADMPLASNGSFKINFIVQFYIILFSPPP